MGRQHQGMDKSGVRQVPEGSGEQGKMEKTGCKIICGTPTTLVVKELMMLMMSSKGAGSRTERLRVKILPQAVNVLPPFLYFQGGGLTV